MEDKEKNKYDDTLAELERSQNYKAYYNQAIQNYNMEQNTKKYMDSVLQNQGLSGSGYGSSIQAGIGNTAMNMYNQIASDYTAREKQISADAFARYQNAQLEQDEQLTTFLSTADSPETMNKYLQNYGYMDDKGEYTEKWNELPADRQAYLKSVYELYSEDPDTGTHNYVDTAAFADTSFITSKGKKTTISSQFNKIYTTLEYNVQKNTYPNNAVIRLEQDGEVAYVKYKNGQFSLSNADEYKNSKEKQYYVFYERAGKNHVESGKGWEEPFKSTMWG